MPTTVISADNLSTTTIISTTDASVVINATLSAITAVAVTAEASLVVNGSLIGFGSVLGNDVGLTADHNLLLINHGTISGQAGIAFNRDVFGLPFIGNELNIVINDGTIQGDGFGHAAIEDNITPPSGGSPPTSTVQHIFNTGQIIGVTALKLGSKDSLTVNGGTIVGTGGTAIVTGNDNDVVRNSGSIDGAVTLGNGINSIENSGRMTGALTFGTGDDDFDNSGTVRGAVAMGSGLNTFRNQGFVEGAVTFNTGADSFDNSGTIHGDVDMGDGNNSFKNSSLIDGAVSFGLDDDAFINTGEITAGIHSLGGSDEFINYGLIHGDDVLDTVVGLGDDSDTFTNYGVIVGAAILGEGNDLFDTSEGIFHGLIRGFAGNDTILGSSASNEITGDAGDDSLTGNGGVDSLTGGTGNDTLEGGLGSDILDGSTDVFGSNTDLASYRHATSGVTASLADAGLNTGEAAGDIFIEIEGLEGSAHADILIGDGNLNSLFGLDGNDRLLGGGNLDFLFGGNGDDTLDGGTGGDGLSGQAGRDTYFIDDAGDFIFESANGEIDTAFISVSYVLDSNARLEAMIANAGGTGLTLTGNGFAQTITGGTGKDTLLGGGAADTLLGGSNDDRLDGGTAADTMSGQSGRDTYIIDNAGDLIIETASPEIDTALISVNYTLGAAAQVEAIIANAGATGLALTGNGFAQSITGAAGKDTLNGGAGNDTLDGGTQADQLNGQAGRDTYIVDNAGDVVVETALNEIDTVLARLSYTLGAAAQIEALIANAGATGLALAGNGFAQTITGSLGNDTLSGAGGNDTLLGGIGADTLNGGAGLDRFVFNTALGPANIDRIAGFVHDLDLIQLDDTIFKKIGAKLDAAEFHAAAGAKVGHDASDRIIYDTTTGRLYFDIDGNKAGGKAAILFATLDTKPLIDAGDFGIV